MAPWRKELMRREPTNSDFANPPAPNVGWWAAAGVFLGLLLLLLVPLLRPAVTPAVAPSLAAPAEPEAPVVAPVDLAAVRARAWEKIQPRLAEADAASAAAIDQSLEPLHYFFAQRKAGTRPFAEAVLSLRGKWRYMKARLPGTDDNGHFAFLQEKFAHHVFRPEDLKAAMEGAIARYVSAVQGVENQLLVNVRADLSDSELRLVADAVPALRGEAVFRQEYQRLLNSLVPTVAGDVNVALSRELTAVVGAEVAAKLAARVAVAVSTRLGVSAGLLGTGAAAGWATFGVGLAAAIVIDLSVDWLLKQGGYDPAGDVAAKVNQTMDRVRLMIVTGDDEAHAVYAKLRAMQEHDPSAAVRAESEYAAGRIAASGNLGLRFAMTQLHEGRGKLRREALRRLIAQGGD
jgi:hypothetical protein